MKRGDNSGWFNLLEVDNFLYRYASAICRLPFKPYILLSIFKPISIKKDCGQKRTLSWFLMFPDYFEVQDASVVKLHGVGNYCHVELISLASSGKKQNNT